MYTHCKLNTLYLTNYQEILIQFWPEIIPAFVKIPLHPLKIDNN